MKFTVRVACIALCATVSISSSVAAPILLNSPSLYWTAIPLSSLKQFDYPDDQQTGNQRSAADIVGDATQHALYVYFDDGGTYSPTDGTLYFRVRLGNGAASGGDRFNGVFLVGIDGNYDSSVSKALDIFAGIDMKGTNDAVAIWNAGNDLNVSPSTTSVQAPTPQFRYPLSSANYHYGTVQSIDGVASDIDLDGRPDWFLSFRLPFADVVAEMNRLRGVVIDERTPLRFIIATSEQANALNQDVGGLTKSEVSSSTTWENLGAFSVGYQGSPDGVVPEPGTLVLAGIGIGGLLALRARRSAGPGR